MPLTRKDSTNALVKLNDEGIRSMAGEEMEGRTAHTNVVQEGNLCYGHYRKLAHR